MPSSGPGRRNRWTAGWGAATIELTADDLATIQDAVERTGAGQGTLLGWWWAEYVAAFALLVFVGREAWEALEAATVGKGRCEDQ